MGEIHKLIILKNVVLNVLRMILELYSEYGEKFLFVICTSKSHSVPQVTHINNVNRTSAIIVYSRSSLNILILHTIYYNSG